MKTLYAIIGILLLATPSWANPLIALSGSPSNLSQTISLTPSADLAVGAADTAITCSSSSGLACALDTTNHSYCTIVAGALHAVAASGTDGCVITANQAGNATYAAAAQVTDSVTISGGSVTIVAYFNTATNDNTSDINTNGTAMTKGTGKPGYTSDFTVQNNTPSTGLHALYRAGGYSYQFQIPTASNVSATLGTMSFYWHATTIAASPDIFVAGDINVAPYWSWVNGTSTSINFRYMNIDYTPTGIGAATTVNLTDWYWVTATWDGANTKAAIRVYNETTSTWIRGSASTWSETTGLSGSVPSTPASLNFHDFQSYQNTQAFSQIMFSAAYKDDHFSKRTSTSP